MLSATNFFFVRSRASSVPRPVKPLLPFLKPTPHQVRFKRAPADLKKPFVVRPFQKDKHVAAIQHLENRGMYKEELDIERARFPKMSKSVSIHCDGSLTEREFEFTVPPVVVLFRDRHSVYLEQLSEHRRLGSDGWRCMTGKAAPVLPKMPQEAHEQKYNMLCFPYCVPTKLPMRRRPALSQKKEGIMHQEQEKAKLAAAAEGDD